jgi:hypothetical protein
MSSPSISQPPPVVRQSFRGPRQLRVVPQPSRAWSLYDVPPHVVAAQIARTVLTRTAVRLPASIWDVLRLLTYLPTTAATVRDLGARGRRPWNAAELYAALLAGLSAWSGPDADRFKSCIAVFLQQEPLLRRNFPLADRRMVTVPKAHHSGRQPRRCAGRFVRRADRGWVHTQLGFLDEQVLRVWVPDIAHFHPGCTHAVATTWTQSWTNAAGLLLSTWTVLNPFGSRRPTVTGRGPHEQGPE